MRTRRLTLALGLFMGSTCWLGLSLINVAAGGGAQQSAQPTPATASGVVKAEANLVLVDVVATDKKGNSVQDLEQRNFRLYEDDKEQVITTFSRTSATALEGPSQPRYLALFFDNTTMAPSDQMQVRKDAGEFLKKTASKERLAAVLDFVGSLRITQNFTADGDLLERAATGVKFAGVSPNERGQNTEVASLGGPTGIQMRTDFAARSVLLALRSAVKDLASVRGRKILILFSAGFPLTSDRQSELTATIDAANKANVAIYTVDVRGLKGIQSTPEIGMPGSVFGPGAARQDSPFPHLRSLHAALLWLPMPWPQRPGGGGTGGGGGGTPGGGTGGGAGGGGSTGGGGIGGGGARGAGGAAGGGGATGGTAPGGNTGSRGSNPGGNPSSRGNPGNTGRTNNNPLGPSNAYGDQQFRTRDLFERMNIPRLESTTTNQQVLYALAAGTGGFTIFNTNNFGPELDKVARDLQEYYVLGYVPPNPIYDGRYHRIRVKLDRKGVTVRFRNGYFDTKSPDLLAGKPEGKALEERAMSPQPGDIPVTLRVVHFYNSANIARVNLALDIPAKTLDVEKLKGKLHSEVNVLGIAYREDGSVAARFSDAVKLDFEKSEWQQFLKGPFRYYNNFSIGPGRYLFRVVLGAGGQKFGKYEVPLTIEPYSGQEFSLSDLALSNRVVPISQVTASLDAALLEERAPLVANGVELMLSSNNRFKRSDMVGLYVEVYEPQMLKPLPPTVGIIMAIVDRKTNQQVFNSNTIRVNGMAQPGNPIVPVVVPVPLTKLPAGDYRLEVQARDATGNVSTLRQAEFTLEESTP